MSAAQLKDLLRAGCAQVFLPVIAGGVIVAWARTTQREARHLRTQLRGQLDVAPPDPELDNALAGRCGGGRILRLVPRPPV